jgi:precorrin-2 dehydrogenase/sirohydrochlorin ferrochelatase
VNAVFLAGLVVAGRRCVVLGGDVDALARARALADAGGHVVVVSEHVGPDLKAMAAARELEWLSHEPRVVDADGAFLVVNTLRDETLSAALLARAEAGGGFLLCCVDQPAYSTFTHAATLRRGPLQIAVTTNGEAPMLASRIRAALERGLGPEFKRFVERVVRLRRDSDRSARRDVMERALDGFELDVRVRLPAESDE